MFLHVFVCPQGVGVTSWGSAFGGGMLLEGGLPPEGACLLRGVCLLEGLPHEEGVYIKADLPRDTVDRRPVPILLECILVVN